MPHVHIFMQKEVVDALLVKTTTGYHLDRNTGLHSFVGNIVREAFEMQAGEELAEEQVVRNELRITHSMPVDMCVNITAWYTPERAPHFKAIEREVAEKLAEWAPRLNIEVHLVVVGAPQFSELATGTATFGSQLS